MGLRALWIASRCLMAEPPRAVDNHWSLVTQPSGEQLAAEGGCATDGPPHSALCETAAPSLQSENANRAWGPMLLQSGRVCLGLFCVAVWPPSFESLYKWTSEVRPECNHVPIRP